MSESSPIDDAIRILVVDDDPQTARLVRSWFEGKPFVVLEAPDGEKGVALAQSERPDVILLDVVMPGLDGLAVAGLILWVVSMFRGRDPVVRMAERHRREGRRGPVAD